MLHAEILQKIKQFLKTFLPDESKFFVSKEKENGRSYREIEIKFISLFHELKIIETAYVNYSAYWQWNLKSGDKDWAIAAIKDRLTID